MQGSREHFASRDLLKNGAHVFALSTAVVHRARVRVALVAVSVGILGLGCAGAPLPKGDGGAPSADAALPGGDGGARVELDAGQSDAGQSDAGQTPDAGGCGSQAVLPGLCFEVVRWLGRGPEGEGESSLVLSAVGEGGQFAGVLGRSDGGPTWFFVLFQGLDGLHEWPSARFPEQPISSVWAINRRGTAGGSAQVVNPGGSSGDRGVRRLLDGGAEVLPLGPSTYCRALDDFDNSLCERRDVTYIWFADGGVLALDAGVAANGERFRVEAFALSNSGYVVGRLLGAGDAVTPGIMPFRRWPNGRFERLASPGRGQARAVLEDGTAAGRASFIRSNEPGLWRPDGGFERLATKGAFTEGIAHGLNSWGLVVGELDDGARGEKVLWFDGGVVFFSDLVADAGLMLPASALGPTEDGFVGVTYRTADAGPRTESILYRFWRAP